jgi:hypothetical protein
VTSPGCGLGLSKGIYCLMAKCNSSSCLKAVARAYSRICWQGRTCSLMWKKAEVITKKETLCVYHAYIYGGLIKVQGRKESGEAGPLYLTEILDVDPYPLHLRQNSICILLLRLSSRDFEQITRPQFVASRAPSFPPKATLNIPPIHPNLKQQSQLFSFLVATSVAFP